MAQSMEMTPAGPAAPVAGLLEPSPHLKIAGIDKAAVLLVALGEENAAKVISQLSLGEQESLSLHIAQAKRVAPDVRRAVVGEAVENVMGAEFVSEGGVDYARALLERSLGPERAGEIIGRLAATIERRPFECLRRTPPEQIVVLLGSESLQTVAVVIANLHANLAAAVLCALPPESQAEVARRVATMSECRPEVVEQVEAVMRQKLSSVIAQEFAAAGGIKPLAEILNNADRTTERNVLDKLAEDHAELAEEIRMLLFTFEDVAGLDDRSIQMVLKEIDQKDLAIALRGVPEEVQERMYSNMSERGAELLRDEISFQPPQRRRVIEEAQGRIVAAVRRLEEAGSLTIARGAGGDDELM
jgi:flagellar motor switch protein FliG